MTPLNQMTASGDRTVRESLTWEKLVAMRDSLPKPIYTFRVPRLDHVLDIRDYELREVEGVYLLHRKEAPNFGSIASTEPLKLHPAQFIWLQRATAELAQEPLTMFPELKPSAVASEATKNSDERETKRASLEDCESS